MRSLHGTLLALLHFEVPTVTIELAIASSHLEVLSRAAAQSKLTIQGYIHEIVEAHAAGLLLPSVPSSGGPAFRGVQQPEARNSESFPWPEKIYTLHLPRHG
jgi:hypothetical protein